MFLHHFKAYNTTNSELFEFLKYLERFPRYSKNKKKVFLHKILQDIVDKTVKKLRFYDAFKYFLKNFEKTFFFENVNVR